MIRKTRQTQPRVCSCCKEKKHPLEFYAKGGQCKACKRMKDRQRHALTRVGKVDKRMVRTQHNQYLYELAQHSKLPVATVRSRWDRGERSEARLTRPAAPQSREWMGHEPEEWASILRRNGMPNATEETLPKFRRPLRGKGFTPRQILRLFEVEHSVDLGRYVEE